VIVTAIAAAAVPEPRVIVLRILTLGNDPPTLPAQAVSARETWLFCGPIRTDRDGIDVDKENAMTSAVMQSPRFSAEEPGQSCRRTQHWNRRGVSIGIDHRRHGPQTIRQHS
jgi:hypothetical protein